MTHPGQIGSLSCLLSGSVFQNRHQDLVVTDNTGTDPQGQTRLDQEVVDASARRTHGIHFTPRLNYRFDNGDSLILKSGYGGGWRPRSPPRATDFLTTMIYTHDLDRDGCHATRPPNHP